MRKVFWALGALRFSCCCGSMVNPPEKSNADISLLSLFVMTSKSSLMVAVVPTLVPFSFRVTNRCPYRVNSVQACRLKFGQGRKLVFG